MGIGHRAGLVALLAAGVWSVAAAAPPAERGDEGIGQRVRPLVEQAMAVEATPALQVAVVLKDGRAWTGAFGVQDLQTGEAATVESRFYIASTTKALTALAAARRHHRGIIDLDASITKHLPGVTLPDCVGEEEITLKSLLTHTHGLRNAPLQWRTAFTGEFTNELLIGMIARSECHASREFRYSNLGYDLIGLVLDPVQTGGWRRIVDDEVLRPLGMVHTTSVRSTLDEGVLAMPHETEPGGMRRIPLTKGDANLGAAGGHFTTAEDLGRLLLAEMNRGVLGGKQVIEPEVIEATQQRWVTQDRTFFHYERTHWGLGWDIGLYEGQTVYHRPGGFAGYYSNAAFLPEQGLGVVVLVNGGALSAGLAEAVAGAIYDEFHDRDDVQQRLAARLDDLRSRKERVVLQAPPQMPAFAEQPTEALDAYVGKYFNSDWGTMTVERSGAGLQISMGPMRGELRPVAGEADVFFTMMRGRPDMVEFAAEGSAPKASLKFRRDAEIFTRSRP